MNLMVTTNQISIIDINKEREMNPNITLKIVIKSERKWAKEERRNYKEPQKTSKTINKMALSTYLSNITLNVNGVMLQSKDIEWLNGYKNKTHVYICCSPETHFRSKDID